MIAADHVRIAAPTDALCRGCRAQLSTVVADLGSCPPSNQYLTAAELHAPVMTFPLKAFVCDTCFLVQLEAFHDPAAIFSDYLYFSSYSETWLAHGAAYADSITTRRQLDRTSLVVEIASNDGYLLRHFAQRQIPVLGIEPAANVAQAAMAAGIHTITEFFGTRLATELRARGIRPDVLIANNVLAHVPDLHDFVAGIAIMLDADAICTIEFPHLVPLIEHGEFDTIYHEHFSYFSLLALEPIFAQHGLTIVDVDQLSTHGGSLRIYVARANATHPVDARVDDVRRRERTAGLDKLATYRAFAGRIVRMKADVLRFLLEAQRLGKSVVAYGAPAKGNTFLTYCGIRTDLIEFTVDRSPHKQGRFLPGSHIPIFAPAAIRERRPDYVLILAWNLADEIMEQMREIGAWGGRFVTAIPSLVIHA